MNEDCLKLTTYFGERDRANGRPLADELLDIYGGHRLQASILMRGAVGFGRLHHLHTDRQLTLSEDLPAVSVAVDTRRRIESMLEVVTQVKQRGLITLERARLVTGEGGSAAVASESGDASKLTVYVGRQERIGTRPAFVAVCDLLQRRGVAGGTVLLGVDGTRLGKRERAAFFSRNAEVPLMIIAVGAGAGIAAVLPELGEMLQRPVMTLERVRVCKRDGELLARPHALPGIDEHGLAMWQKLMVYASEAATVDGLALHLAIIRALRRSDAAGATTLRGLWGFHDAHAPHGDRFLQLRRHVPTVTVIVDTPEGIARSFEIVDSLTRQHGLVTSEMVPAMRSLSEHERRGGLRLARHDY